MTSNCFSNSTSNKRNGKIIFPPSGLLLRYCASWIFFRRVFLHVLHFPEWFLVGGINVTIVYISHVIRLSRFVFRGSMWQNYTFSWLTFLSKEGYIYYISISESRQRFLLIHLVFLASLWDRKQGSMSTFGKKGLRKKTSFLALNLINSSSPFLKKKPRCHLEIRTWKTKGGELLPAENEGEKNSSQYFIKYLSRLIMLKMYRKCTGAPFTPFLMR